MTSRGPKNTTVFPSSHHEKRLYTIKVQLKPFPHTWPLLPYPRVSNANTIPTKSPQEEKPQDKHKNASRTRIKSLQINPTHKQATIRNHTIPNARFKQEQHEETKSKSEELLPSQRVMVKMVS